MVIKRDGSKYVLDSRLFFHGYTYNNGITNLYCRGFLTKVKGGYK